MRVAGAVTVENFVVVGHRVVGAFAENAAEFNGLSPAIAGGELRERFDHSVAARFIVADGATLEVDQPFARKILAVVLRHLDVVSWHAAVHAGDEVRELVATAVAGHGPVAIDVLFRECGLEVRLRF